MSDNENAKIKELKDGIKKKEEEISKTYLYYRELVRSYKLSDFSKNELFESFYKTLKALVENRISADDKNI